MKFDKIHAESVIILCNLYLHYRSFHKDFVILCFINPEG